MIFGLAGLGAARRDWLCWATVASAAVAFTACVIGILAESTEHPDGLALAISIPAVLCYLNLALLCPLKPGLGWLRWIAIGAAASTAAMSDAAVFTAGNRPADLFVRLASATGIVAGCASVGLLVLAALSRRSEARAVAAVKIDAVDLICPVCRKKQSIALGGASCSGCGLQINIQVEQPHCGHCGYILYGNPSGNCPECGALIESSTVPTMPAELSPAHSPSLGQ